MTKTWFGDPLFQLQVTCEHEATAFSHLPPEVVSLPTFADVWMQVSERRRARIAPGGPFWHDGAGEARQSLTSEATRLLENMLDKTFEDGEYIPFDEDFHRAMSMLANRKSGRPMAATRWRFHCHTCADTLPLVGAKAEAIFEKLRGAGVAKIRLSQLRLVSHAA